ncbi:hypothetical protein NPIL_607231 [Nephila pilipes]|uniref:Uncharacterized protein n=1 Tax=Nephila pilipes TaxID=299642 RepID=A0A8X6MKI3_NEPPI|nr:hypothetical protein NPIL_607231 [Nephila pilipes]
MNAQSKKGLDDEMAQIARTGFASQQNFGKKNFPPETLKEMNLATTSVLIGIKSRKELKQIRYIGSLSHPQKFVGGGWSALLKNC